MSTISLRKYQPEDIDDFFEAVIESKDSISQWLPWCHDRYSKSETETWITEIVPEIWASQKGCEFLIIDQESEKILGGCCLEQLDLAKREANVGYWVRSGETGKGVATRACELLLAYGFSILGLEIIRVIPSQENMGSKRVAEKLPYTTCERVQNGFQIRDQVSDALVYTIMKASYEGSQKQKK